MATRSKDDGTESLEHWFGAFYEATVEGVRDYYRNYSNWAHVHRLTTRRSIIRDHIVHHLRTALRDEAGAAIINKHGTTLFGLVSKYLMKAHMLTKNMVVALNQTQHSIRFNENQSQSDFGDGFEATTLYLGYIPNPSDPFSPSVFLVCPHGAKPAWFLELRQADGAQVVGTIDPRGGLDPEDLVKVPEEIEKKKDE